MNVSTYNTWSVVIAIATGAIVLAGTVIAVRNLRIIAIENRLGAFEAFTRRWADSHSERLWVLEDFNFDPDSPPTLDSDAGQKLRTVINACNEIGLLIDQKVLPAQYVLSLAYSDLIRCHYRLQSYLEYRETELGTRYGRRLEKMAQRARNYHDALPQNRSHPIRIRAHGSSQYITIYMTDTKSGVSGLSQRLSWMAKRMSRNF